MYIVVLTIIHLNVNTGFRFAKWKSIVEVTVLSTKTHGEKHVGSGKPPLKLYLALQARSAWRSRYLLLMIMLPFTFLVIFHYIPMYGAQIAFRNFRPIDGVLGSPWVGFDNFRQFFSSVFFVRVFRNTVVISLLQLAITFPAAIVLSLMINELRVKFLKKTVQTIVYLPHFISVVVVVGIVMGVLAPGSGIVNMIVRAFGGTDIFFFNEPVYFPWILAFIELWQNTGFRTIIYLAALSAIDPGLYEAASIDGASRFKQMLHITIPAIVPTIIILFILAVGGIFALGFQRILLLYNPTIYETADIIQTFVYRRGIVGQEFSFATAVDLFNSTLNLILLLTFNRIMRRVSNGTSLW